MSYASYLPYLWIISLIALIAFQICSRLQALLWQD